jgi:lipopolysaccharide transport system ATP-binding protein
MTNETLIKVDGISKKFCKDLKKSLWYGMGDIARELLMLKQNPELRKGEFWAISDVSFELKRGECLGLLGQNGAGKSTLLKMLNGLIRPDKGRIVMHGRIGALIELGTGFNPILTGRENIYNNGAVLGFSRKEIDRRFDSIVEFSEIEDFIDSPVQNYSSGMKIRLGFAIAAQMEPDVLILDEVLSVGDAGFKNKSMAKMRELIDNTAVIFVTHSMSQIATVCTHALYLNHGQVTYFGNDVNKGIQQYFLDSREEKSGITGSHNADIERIVINGRENTIDSHVPVPYLGTISLQLFFKFRSIIIKYYVILQISDSESKILAQFNSNIKYDYLDPENHTEVFITFDKITLIDGNYNVTYILMGETKDKKWETLAVYRNYTKISVFGLHTNIYAPIHLEGSMRDHKGTELVQHSF